MNKCAKTEGQAEAGARGCCSGWGWGQAMGEASGSEAQRWTIPRTLPGAQLTGGAPRALLSVCACGCVNVVLGVKEHLRDGRSSSSPSTGG